MIISGGENVHPTQVEAVLAEHPGITDAAVVGLPDERWGELVVAYVVASDPALDAAACEAHCNGHPMLAAYKRPRAYRFVSELPMTATGKKVHYQVREQASAATPRDGLLPAPVSDPAPSARDPVVTGIGAITPLGSTAPETWQGLIAGRSGISPIESFDASGPAGPDRRRDPRLRRRGAARPQARSPLGALLASWRSPRRARRSPTPALTPPPRPTRSACVVNSAVRRHPRDRAQHPRADRARPARRQPVLRALDDPQHGRLRGGDRPRRARPGQRQRAGLRERHRRAARGAPPDRRPARPTSSSPAAPTPAINEVDVRRAGADGPAVGAQRRPRGGQPPVRRRPRRVRVRRGRGRAGGRVRRARRAPAAPRSTARSPAAR